MNWQDFLDNLSSVIGEREIVETRECYCGRENYLISTYERLNTVLKPVGSCKKACIVANIISCKLVLHAREKSDQKGISYL